MTIRNLNCLLRKSRTRNSAVRVQHCATLFGTQSIIFCSKYYSESLTHSHSRITPHDVSRGVTVNVPTIENTTVPINIKPPSNFAEASSAKRYFLLYCSFSVCVCHGILLMPTIQNPRPSVWNAKPKEQTKTGRPYRRRQDYSKWCASQVEPITIPLIATNVQTNSKLFHKKDLFQNLLAYFYP